MVSFSNSGPMQAAQARPMQAANFNSKPIQGVLISTVYHFVRNLADCKEYANRVIVEPAAQKHIPSLLDQINPFKLFNFAKEIFSPINKMESAIGICNLADPDNYLFYLTKSPIIPVTVASCVDTVLDAKVPTDSYVKMFGKFGIGLLTATGTAAVLGASAPEAAAAYAIYRVSSAVLRQAGIVS